MVKAHPEGFGRTIEQDGQEDGQGAAEYDEIDERHGPARGERHSNNGDKQFANDQVDGHRAGIIAGFAFIGKIADWAAFVCFEKASEYFPSAAHRAALAQSSFQHK